MDNIEHTLKKELENLISLYNRSPLKQKALPPISLSLTLSGSRILGKARLEQNKRSATIYVHEKAYQQNRQMYIKNIFAHEFAHIITLLLHNRYIRPHGSEFKQVCCALFPDNWQEVSKATLRHGFSLKTKRTYKKHRYSCACGEILLTSIRHNRIQKGKSLYRCRRCGETLKPAPKEAR